MRIERMSVHNFGCLRDADLEFAPGVNIIRGPNEAGKSTLQAAIIATLFHRPDTQDQSVLGRASWAASEAHRLDMTLVAGGETWTVEKDFATGKARLASGEEVCEGARAVQDALGEHLGLRSEELFTSTAFVRQDELAAIGEGREDIGELLQRRVTGGADHVAAQDVLKRLEDEIATMQRGVDRPAPKNPGPIRLAMTRRDEAKAALAAGEEELLGLHGAQDELAKAMEREGELNEQVRVESELLELMAVRQQEEEKLAKAERKYAQLEQRIQKADTLQKEAEDAEAAAEGLSRIAQDGPAGIERIDGVERTVAEKSGRSGQLQADIEGLQQEAMVAPKPWPLVYALTVAGVVLVVAGVVLGMLMTPWAFIGVAAGGALFVYGVAKAWTRPPVDYDAQIAKLQRDLDGSEGEIAEFRDQIASVLADVGCESREELAAKWEEAQGHARTAGQKRSELRGLLGEETMESLLSDQREQLHRRDSAEGRLKAPELAAIGYSAAEHVGQRDKVRRLEAELGQVQQRRAENAGTVKTASVDAEEVAAAREAAAAAAERLSNEQRRLEVYRLVRDVLQEAQEETLSRAAEELGPRTGELLADITRGRYDSVRIDETSLDISVFSPEKGEDVAVESGSAELSCATREQVFLAARLALAELLWPEDPPPLLLDDPFVTFDPERRRAAAGMLQQLAGRGQVMLFTCSGVYDHLGHVIHLGGPSEARGEAEEDALLPLHVDVEEDGAVAEGDAVDLG